MQTISAAAVAIHLRSARWLEELVITSSATVNWRSYMSSWKSFLHSLEAIQEAGSEHELEEPWESRGSQKRCSLRRLCRNKRIVLSQVCAFVDAWVPAVMVWWWAIKTSPVSIEWRAGWRREGGLGSGAEEEQVSIILDGSSGKGGRSAGSERMRKWNTLMQVSSLAQRQGKSE